MAVKIAKLAQDVRLFFLLSKDSTDAIRVKIFSL